VVATPCRISAFEEKENLLKESPEDYQKRIKATLREFCDYLLDEDYNIIFLPMNGATEGKDLYNDLIRHDEMYSNRLFFPEQPLILGGPRGIDNDRMFELIKKCHIVVGHRLHANIMACAYEVPALSLAYNWKHINFAESVGCEAYVAPTNKTFVFENLKQKFESLEENRAVVQQNLKKHIDRAHKVYYEEIRRALARSIAGSLKDVKSVHIRWQSGSTQNINFSIQTT